MNYDVVLAPAARDKLLQMPPGVAWRVREALVRLSESPATLSRRSAFPHPPHFQLHETRLDADGERYFLKVFFFFGQDEQSLLIDDLVLMTLS